MESLQNTTVSPELLDSIEQPVCPSDAPLLPRLDCSCTCGAGGPAALDRAALTCSPMSELLATLAGGVERRVFEVAIGRSEVVGMGGTAIEDSACSAVDMTGAEMVEGGGMRCDGVGAAPGSDPCECQGLSSKGAASRLVLPPAARWSAGAMSWSLAAAAVWCTRGWCILQWAL